jgi:hypothetical protein
MPRPISLILFYEIGVNGYKFAVASTTYRKLVNYSNQNNKRKFDHEAPSTPAFRPGALHADRQRRRGAGGLSSEQKPFGKTNDGTAVEQTSCATATACKPR